MDTGSNFLTSPQRSCCVGSQSLCYYSRLGIALLTVLTGITAYWWHGTCRRFFLKLLKICYTCTAQLFQLQCFVVLMYQISDIVEVNEARKELFTQKSRSLENLAPTSTALEEHLKEELNDNLYMDYTSRSSKFML